MTEGMKCTTLILTFRAVTFQANRKQPFVKKELTKVMLEMTAWLKNV